MASILVLHGPNLNLLGSREPEIYGHETLEDINKSLAVTGKLEGATVKAFQSNAEHELVDAIHRARTDGTQYIIINAGAFTHTSIAIRDALSACAIPFIECHISNVYQREEFRQHSFLSDIADGVICGLGSYGYTLALLAGIKKIKASTDAS